MERKALQIGGISTASNYGDGDCRSVLNLRNEQGVLKPVEPFAVEMELQHSYELLYWHKNNDYANLIGVREGNTYWIRDAGEATENEVRIADEARSIAQSGNIISLTEENRILYLLFDNGEKYAMININLKQFERLIDFGAEYYNTLFCSDTARGIDTGSDSIYDVYLGDIAKLRSKIAEDGYLSDWTIVCYAVKLFDGNIIYTSALSLIEQPQDKMSRFENVLVYEEGGIKTAIANYNNEYPNDPKGVLSNYFGGMRYNTSDSSNGNPFYRNYSSIIDRKYSLTGEEIVETVGDTNYVHDFGKINISFIPSYSWSIHNYYRYFCAHANQFSLLRNKKVNLQLVGSIDVYMSKQLTTVSLEKEKVNRIENNYDGISARLKVKQQDSFQNFDELILYKIASYSVEEFNKLSSNTNTYLDLKGKLGESLYGRENLIFNANKEIINANKQFVYNSQYHFISAEILEHTNSFIEELQFRYLNSGVSGSITSNTSIYMGYVVSVGNESGNELVNVSEFSAYIRSDSYEDLNLCYPFIISEYNPNVKFVKVTIYKDYNYDDETKRIVGKKLEISYELQEKSGIRFWLSNTLKRELMTFNDVDEVYSPPQNISRKFQSNELVVSFSNNPANYEKNNVYQVGDGEILNMGSQSIRTSDGQFGQYPLILFCTDGIFSMQVGDGGIAYSRVVSPQSYERPISEVICTTPFGIVFISNRGLCIIAGQNVTYLSERVWEKYKDIHLEIPMQIEESFSDVLQDLSNGSSLSFNDYLKGVTTMIYNPREQEIIIINADKEYNYVYNFVSKQLYRNDERINGEIANSLPDLQVWFEGKIKNVTNYDLDNEKTRSVGFITRPMKLQTPDLKRFERIILRGYLKMASDSEVGGAKKSVAAIWGSLDDKNFKLLRGLLLESGMERKDIDFGLFGATTYRSYVFGFAGTLHGSSEVEAMEIEIEKEYNNTKMR